jgi:hypothetical protein
MAASLNRPSAKLCPKTIDPFSTSNSTNNSPFLNAFTSGRIPCRLVHGSVRNRLAWNTSIDDLNYDPILVLLAEGLRETAHPLPFISRQGFTELMSNVNARPKTISILPKLINPIKLALNSNNDEVFEGALNALTQLSTVVGNELDKYLKTYLSIVSIRRRRIMKNKNVLFTHVLVSKTYGQSKVSRYSNKCIKYFRRKWRKSEEINRMNFFYYFFDIILFCRIFCQ